MTMLANRKEAGALTLADYEARIHLYKEQIGTGYIGIGRTLLEAKEAKVVPHGQWEQWMTEATGLTARQAQRCMQAATEIKDGSALARLEMSKALMLLGSGLDEEAREEIAGKAADEGATVKALQEEIRQAKMKLVQEAGAATEMRLQLEQTRRERDDLAGQMRAQIGAYQQRMDEETEKAYREGMKEGQEKGLEEGRRQLEVMDRARQANLEHANKQADKVKALLDKQDGLQSELNKQRQYAEELRKTLDEKEAEYQRMLRQCDEEARAEEREKMAAEAPADYTKDREILLAAAEEAEKRAADAEAELEALKAGQDPKKVPAAVVLSRAVNAFLSECDMLPWSPADLQADPRPIRVSVEMIENWCIRMRGSLDQTVEAEGAVE